jgi:hypothetical protein
MTSQFAVVRWAESLAEQVSQPDERRAVPGRQPGISMPLAGGATRLTSGPRSLPSSVRSTSLGKRPRATGHLRVERSRAPCWSAFVAASGVPSSSRATGRVTGLARFRLGASGVIRSPAASAAATSPYASHPNRWACSIWCDYPRCQDKWNLTLVWRPPAEGIGRIGTKRWDG